ncbi:MAG TPA: RNA polymerase sigma factor [Anaeromyxobacteraceae bacterium]|nr:RNA polymerase sigma factor [Anaeromyxobacteraceae bacterium]
MTLAGADRRDAFTALAGRYLARLARYCAKCTGSPRAGEELAQDVLLEIWNQRHAYRSSGRFRTWLFTLARSRCLNHLRAERRRGLWLLRPRGPGDEHHAPEAPLAPDQIDRLLAAEQARQVRQALLGLSTKLREAVLLRFDQGLDYAEIGRIVGAPEVTVRSRVFLALKQLRAAVGGREDSP